MSFVSNKPKIGDTVVLSSAVHVISGHFTRGTKMEIIGQTPWGWNLKDEDGNMLNDVSSSTFNR
jgi:hypothetical protein